MIHTRVQLPDELYEKAKRFGREREMSLAEVVRRGLEQFLDRYPAKTLLLRERHLRVSRGTRVVELWV